MKLRILPLLLISPFAFGGLTSCTTAKTEAQQEEAAERRVKHATEHIRKVGRNRRPS